MGHATRILALALFIAGVMAFVRFFMDLARPTSETAPFSPPQSSVDERSLAWEPPVAIFSPRLRASIDAPLRIEYLGSEPYFTGATRDALSIALGAEENIIDLAPDSQVTIGEESYRVARLSTWQGLLPVSNGAQMVSVSLLSGDDDSIENVLLRAGQRFDVGGSHSIELRECTGRNDALAQIAAEARSADDGRWGIVDSTGVIWFEGFTPGAGATLMDGSLITLEAFDPSGPTLVVRKRNRESDETLRIEGPSNDPPVLLETGRVRVARLALYVIADGRALVSVGEHESQRIELADGETWDPPGGQTRLRIEQALRSAAPVDASESPFFEVVLDAPRRRLRVRQGEAVRVGDALLRYMRAPDNATAAFRLRISPRPDEPGELKLVPFGIFDFAWAGGHWRVSHTDVIPGESITIRRASRSNTVLIAGVAFIAAAFCLLWIGPHRVPD